MCKMLLNPELNGIELYFDDKPLQSILDTLKAASYRWSNFKKCWYAKQSENTMKIALKYSGVEDQTDTNITSITESTITAATKPEVKKQVKDQVKFNLWNATTWTETEVNSKQEVKEIAAEIRKLVKTRFPMVKFSITSTYNSISFYIMSSPYEKESIYLTAIQDYCTSLLKSYNYCTCYDPYGDYGSSYNFFGSYAKIDWKYTQTEATEEIKTDMLNYDSKLTQQKTAEEERQEAEYQQREIEREEEHKQYLIRQEEEKKEIEIIYISVDITELEEQNQYFVIGSQFANLNKNNTLNEYQEEIEKNDYYLQNVKITKEIHFTSSQALEFFSNNLLTDFDFIQGTGGSYTDDNRINSMTDYYNMTKEEQQTVIFNNYGVAIYFNNKLQFIVDAQGFSYSRYVGLVDNVTIQNSLITDQTITDGQLEELKNNAEVLTDISTTIITDNNLLNIWNNEKWTEYKELYKEELNKCSFKLSKSIIQQLPEEHETLKVAMYKLLTEVDGIQEQFKNANIIPGQKLTMFYISDWGSISTNKITFDNVQYIRYAQYENAVKVEYIPQGKKSKYYNHFYSTLLVYNNWIELPDTVLNTIESTDTITIKRSKYLSCDKQQYDEILNYFEAQGIKPIINTYRQQF